MYRMTVTYEIWDDDDADNHLEVGEDAEGLDQVEIREHHYDDIAHDDVDAVCCTPEQAVHLVAAIQSYLSDPQRNTQAVWDEESHTHLEVGKPNGDPESGEEPESGDLFVEIREFDEDEEETSVICVTLEQVVYVKNAIHRYLKARSFLEENPTGAIA